MKLHCSEPGCPGHFVPTESYPVLIESCRPKLKLPRPYRCGGLMCPGHETPLARCRYPLFGCGAKGCPGHGRLGDRCLL